MENFRLKLIIEKSLFAEIPDYLLRRINVKYRELPINVDPKKHDSIAPTCVAHDANDLGIRIVKFKSFPHGLCKFFIREFRRLQGFPDDLIFRKKECFMN